METIVVAIMFSVPGILVNRINKRLFPKSFYDNSEYEKTVVAIPTSIIVLFINYIVMNKLFNLNITSIDILIDRMNNLRFLFKYTILTFISCVVVALIIEKVFKNLVLKASNIYRKIKNIPIETQYTSAWESIFENENEPVNDMYIVIEKDGKVVTQGLVEEYTPPNNDKRDISLVFTKQFEQCLNEEENLPDDEKMFGIIDREYYDFNTGVLIKIYNNEKIKKRNEEEKQAKAKK